MDLVWQTERENGRIHGLLHAHLHSRERREVDCTALREGRHGIALLGLGASGLPPPRTPAEAARTPRFCAVEPLPEERKRDDDPMPYNLRNARDEAQAEREGWMITHRGACGACSSLQNLAIYIAYPDLTEPVRGCGIGGLFNGSLSRLACIASLGFDLPCAQAWDLNTESTQAGCLTVCGNRRNREGAHNKPYLKEDEAPPGQNAYCSENGLRVTNELLILNDCLVCDEVLSGDQFKAAAGRTRRASGLPSAICRLCKEVSPIDHRQYENWLNQP